jgi:hypothetical protein
MGLFRGIIILVLGIFFIKMSEKGQNRLSTIPVFGESLKKLFETNRDYMIVLLLAFSQILF